MIEKIWLYPPLAFARLGPSPEPCENYRYGDSDLSPRGTGKTVVLPEPSLHVAENGTLTETQPEGNRVRFKDPEDPEDPEDAKNSATWFRPICPFFEVHGTWTIDGQRHSGAITTKELDAFDLTPGNVRWTVEVANLKAHQRTRALGDRIEAKVEIPGNEHTRRPLQGRSPREPPSAWSRRGSTCRWARSRFRGRVRPSPSFDCASPPPRAWSTGPRTSCSAQPGIPYRPKG